MRNGQKQIAMVRCGPVGRESSNSYVGEALESVTTGCIFNNEVTIGFSSVKE
jgi:hypothetical protein